MLPPNRASNVFQEKKALKSIYAMPCPNCGTCEGQEFNIYTEGALSSTEGIAATHQSHRLRRKLHTPISVLGLNSFEVGNSTHNLKISLTNRLPSCSLEILSIGSSMLRLLICFSTTKKPERHYSHGWCNDYFILNLDMLILK